MVVYCWVTWYVVPIQVPCNRNVSILLGNMFYGTSKTVPVIIKYLQCDPISYVKISYLASFHRLLTMQLLIYF